MPPVPSHFRVQHTCLGCGSRFSYLVQREIPSPGITEVISIGRAGKLARKAHLTDVRYHSCPACGFVQPEMIALRRDRKLFLYLLFGSSAAIMGFAFAGSPIGMTLGACLSTPLAMFAALLWTRLALFNPNRGWANDPAGIGHPFDESSARLDLSVYVNESPRAVFRMPVIRNRISVGLAVLCVLAINSPRFAALALGWKYNWGWWPEYAGPGDRPQLKFADSINCVDGMWRGDVRVAIRNPEDFPRPLKITASTKSKVWGKEIIGLNVSSRSETLYATIEIEPSSELAWKTLDLEVIIDATYPQEVGRGLRDVRQTFQKRSTLVLSEPYAGSKFIGLFLGGHVLVLLLQPAIWSLQFSVNRRLYAQRSIAHELFEDDLLDREVMR